MKSPLPEYLLRYARDMREHSTDAEERLWFFLRDRRFGGHKFRRQHPFPPYILDYYCHQKRLVIELDGGQHQQMPDDLVRSGYLQGKGLRVLRYWNNELLLELESVLQSIWLALND